MLTNNVKHIVKRTTWSNIKTTMSITYVISVPVARRYIEVTGHAFVIVALYVISKMTC